MTVDWAPSSADVTGLRPEAKWVGFMSDPSNGLYCICEIKHIASIFSIYSFVN